MPRGIKGKTEICTKCGSTERVDSGACVECRREYGREYYRRKLAKNAAAGGPLVPRERRGFCSGKRRVAPPLVIQKPRMDFGVPLAPYVAVSPVKQIGRRVPPAWAPMAEKLQHPCWVAHYTREGSLAWARREAGL